MNSSRRQPRRRNRRRRPLKRRKAVTTGQVRRIIDAELKVFDLGAGTVLPSVVGATFHMSNIGPGDTSSQRTGNWIKPITLMGTITLQGNSAASSAVVPQYRVGVCCWKENEDVNPFAIAQIMSDTSAPHQQYSVVNKGQFKILWSRTGVLSNDVMNPQFQKVLRFYVKPPLKCLYSAGDFKNNQLFIFGYSQISDAANPPSILFDSRLRYTDS